MADNILLIDDEPNLTELTAAYLRMNNFSVRACNDPREALAVAQEQHYDALFVDLMMFPMDGITILRRIRELPDYGRTPVFVLSAKVLSNEERKELLTLRVQFIPKPFHPRDLANRLKQALAAE